MNLDFQRIWQQLSADKRKLGLMATLLGLAVLLWGRLLLKDVPRTANATPAAVAADAAEAAAGDKALTDNTPVDRPVVFVRLADEVDRDLFRFDRSFYPEPETEGNRGSAAKLTRQSTDDSPQAREAERSVREAAGRLTLNSTLLGPQPRAVINGVLLAPGESIGGFTLKQVRSRAVTVTRDGFEIVLEM